MKYRQKTLISYAYSFLCFLLRNLSAEDMGSIKAIYLFGSVASGNPRPDSDVDIFVDCKKDVKVVGKAVQRIREMFYESEVFDKWKLQGVENPLNIITGRLEEYRSAQNITKGIVMYGRQVPAGMKEYFVVSWSPVKDVKKRVKVSRKLFGYWGRNKKYRGIVSPGERIAGSAVIVDSEKAEKVISVLRDAGIEYNTRSVFVQ